MAGSSVSKDSPNKQYCYECSSIMIKNQLTAKCDACFMLYHIGCLNVLRFEYYCVRNTSSCIVWFCESCMSTKGAKGITTVKLISIEKSLRKMESYMESIEKKLEKLDTFETGLSDLKESVKAVLNTIKKESENSNSLLKNFQIFLSRVEKVDTSSWLSRVEQSKPIDNCHVTNEIGNAGTDIHDKNPTVENMKSIPTTACDTGEVTMRKHELRSDIKKINNERSVENNKVIFDQLKRERLDKRKSRSHGNSLEKHATEHVTESNREFPPRKIISHDEERSLLKIRPILVKFETSLSKKEFTKNLRRLKNVPNSFNKITVKHDETPSEREPVKKFRNDASDKNARNPQGNDVYVTMGSPWSKK